MLNTKCLLVVFFMFSVAFLAVDFLTNPFKLGSSGVFEEYQMGEDDTVCWTMACSLQKGFFSSCCLPYSSSTEVYTSQVGLQTLVPCVLIRVGGWSIEPVMHGLGIVMALCLAATLTAFAFYIGKEFGKGTGFIFWLLVALSDGLVFIGRNVGRVYFLFLLPFVVSWFLYPRVLDKRLRPVAFLWIIGGLIFIRACCGYEFITNVILSASVAPLYFGIVRKLPFRIMTAHVIKITAVGVVALAVALSVNIIQTSCYYGSINDGFRVVYGKAAARTIGPESQLKDLGRDGGDALRPFETPFSVLSTSLRVRATTLPFGVGINPNSNFPTFLSFFQLGLPLAIFPFLVGMWVPVLARYQRELFALSAALIWSMLGTTTWLFMAAGWTSHHYHIIDLVFYIAYLPMLFVVFGRIVVVLIEQVVSCFSGATGRRCAVKAHQSAKT